MIDRGQFDTRTFIVIAPAANLQVHAACSTYRDKLSEPADDKVGFASVTLEHVIEAIGAAGQGDYPERLLSRYCDFDRVEALASAATV